MRSISLCMIVKNEEEVLAGCLESVQELVNEIIIVDTGSTDRTKEIAAEYTSQIFDFEWIDDFSAARNYSFSKATGEYIMWLDADDILLPKDQEAFRTLWSDLTDEVDVVSMYYHTSLDSAGRPLYLYRRNRVVKRSKNFRWQGAVHEYLEFGGNIVDSDIAVTHRKGDKTVTISDRNLRIYESYVASGRELTPRDMFYYANELKDHGKFERAKSYYMEFLQSEKGWVEDNIRACQYLADCCKAEGDMEAYRAHLFRSFQYDRPRPEFCCLIGDLLTEDRNYHAAAYWYEQALDYEGKELPGFSVPAYTTWYPYLQLTLCYSRIGSLDQAKSAHEKAVSYNPDHPSVRYNTAFFEKLSL
ncbi:glycosyltransferase [Terribacillus sp. JSM ZJ617]|uniref:tetratricopeptide repeat-containing glycosyltransferase family 2 protein n=1 Tax=Terribacillus sp. JSM ZJ617 TaxID=3342119 RepID=UPI0035A94598